MTVLESLRSQEACIRSQYSLASSAWVHPSQGKTCDHDLQTLFTTTAGTVPISVVTDLPKPRFESLSALPPGAGFKPFDSEETNHDREKRENPDLPHSMFDPVDVLPDPFEPPELPPDAPWTAAFGPVSYVLDRREAERSKPDTGIATRTASADFVKPSANSTTTPPSRTAADHGLFEGLKSVWSLYFYQSLTTNLTTSPSMSSSLGPIVPTRTTLSSFEDPTVIGDFPTPSTTHSRTKTPLISKRKLVFSPSPLPNLEEQSFTVVTTTTLVPSLTVSPVNSEKTHDTPIVIYDSYHSIIEVFASTTLVYVLQSNSSSTTSPTPAANISSPTGPNLYSSFAILTTLTLSASPPFTNSTTPSASASPSAKPRTTTYNAFPTNFLHPADANTTSFTATPLYTNTTSSATNANATFFPFPTPASETFPIILPTTIPLSVTCTTTVTVPVNAGDPKGVDGISTSYIYTATTTSSVDCGRGLERGEEGVCEGGVVVEAVTVSSIL